MILSDYDIKERMKEGSLKIIPEPEDIQMQPNSVNLTLDNEVMAFRKDVELVDTKNLHEDLFETIVLDSEVGFAMPPMGFVLASTKEYVEIPDTLMARVDGRSSFGRLGITSHVTAGMIDSGFKGNITLEIVNNSGRYVRLYPGQKICQLVFEELLTPCERPYGSSELNSKYQGQKGVTESRLEG